MKIFETDDLIIRRFEPSDAARLYEYHLDDEVKKWIPNESYADLDEASGAIVFFAGMTDKNTLPYVMGVESKATGDLIGDVGINEVEGRPGEVEIGFVISPEYRRRGYAVELVNFMTDFCRDKFKVRTLYGRVLKGNRASVCVLEKCGYIFAGEESGAEDDPYGCGMLVYKKNC